MSIREIKKKLKDKGIVPEDIYYERNSLVPEGYAAGYTIQFSEDDCTNVWIILENSYKGPELSSFKKLKMFGLMDTYMDFDTKEDIFDWIELIPDLRGN